MSYDHLRLELSLQHRTVIVADVLHKVLIVTVHIERILYVADVARFRDKSFNFRHEKINSFQKYRHDLLR